MSLYPGPTIAQDFVHGRDQGYTEGEHDLTQGRGFTPAVMEAARFDASAANTRNERAFWLGYLRGYREAARTRTFVRDADGEAISERWRT